MKIVTLIAFTASSVLGGTI